MTVAFDGLAGDIDVTTILSGKRVDATNIIGDIDSVLRPDAVCGFAWVSERCPVCGEWHQPPEVIRASVWAALAASWLA